MARILLGVSGGIAAYKALELVRLATAAGHAVRVVQTPASQRFVGAASFAALTGAPVLTDEFERDPARGAFPGQRAARPRPALPPRARPQRRRLPHRAGVGEHDRQARAGLADNLLTSAALAATCPLRRRAGDEQPHVGAPGDAGERRDAARARRRRCSSPAPAGSPRKGEAGAGRLPEPRRAARRDRGARAAAGRAADAPLAGVRVLVTAGGTREPIDAVRFVGNRSSGRMGFALAERGGRAAAPTSRSSRRTSRSPRDPRVRYVDVETAAELQEAPARRVRGRRRAADGRRRRRLPPGAQARRASSRRPPTSACASSSSARRTSSPASPPRAAPTRRSSASPPSTATARSTTAATSSRARASTRSSSTTSRAPTSASSPPTTRSRSSRPRGETHVARASKAEVARAVLDAVARCGRARSAAAASER